MKRILLILTLGATLAGSILFPFFASRCLQDTMSRGMEMLSALSSFLTLIIALLLYNKFGIEQTLLDKQTTAVFSLVDAMKKVRLVMQADSAILLFTVKRDKFDFLKSEGRGDKTLLFEYRYLDAIKGVSEAMENAFMPLLLVEQFEPLRTGIFNAVPFSETVSEEYLLVDALFESGEKTLETYGILNNQKISLNEYTNRWKTFVDSVESWLRQNSVLKVNLNM